MVENLVEMIKLFDEKRSWDLFSPSHSILHLMEELGEACRCILHIDQYKTSSKAKQVLVEELSLELADILIMLIKISNLYGIDLVSTAKKTLSRLESTVDPDKCLEEVDSYVEANLDGFKSREQHLMRKMKFTSKK